jgi:ApaG protein
LLICENGKKTLFLNYCKIKEQKRFMTQSGNSEAVTEGIRVEVYPEFIPEQSVPAENKYVFAYKVVITNESRRKAKLVSRRWVIINADGDREDVEGPGVVGYTPELEPGESFEYTSFCPLNTSWGTMEGSFSMIDESGEEFDVQIARFYLFDPALVQSEG